MNEIYRTFIQTLGYEYHPGDQLNILALQGVSEKDGAIVPNANKIDEYNDLIICLKGEEVRFFTGTIDPGLYYSVHPMTGKGVAHLAFTQHSYVKGLHRGKYPALRALNEKLWLIYDYDRNYAIDDVDTLELSSKSGINIHAGGIKDGLIGKNSAGCINIAGGWNGLDWMTFMNMVNTSARDLFLVTVWFGRDFIRYSASPKKFQPTLRFGVIQKEVKKVQRLLDCGSDGIFGRDVSQKVKGFQRQNSLDIDGVVGPNTWKKLNKLK